jgi:hypothetical protein
MTLGGNAGVAAPGCAAASSQAHAAEAMFTHHQHSRSRSVGLLDDDPSSSPTTVPSSPSSFSKPGSHITRQRNSSSGGGSTPTSTGGAASPGGGYATRHSLSQIAAASAGAEVSNGGRSLTGSRRASVTDRPTHRRSPSHGIVDAGSISSPSSTEKAR